MALIKYGTIESSSKCIVSSMLLAIWNLNLFQTCLEFCVRLSNFVLEQIPSLDILKISQEKKIRGKALPEEWACRGFRPLREYYGSNSIFQSSTSNSYYSLEILARWDEHIEVVEYDTRASRILFFMFEINRKVYEIQRYFSNSSYS
jgi:hypothetical protein